MFPDRFDTRRLILRPIAASDAPAIFMAYAREPAVTTYLTWRPHAAPEVADAYVAACLAATDARTYAIVARDTRTLIGAFDLRAPAAHRLSFGFVLSCPFWRLGLTTEALTAVVSWSMRRTDIWRIEAVCDVDNRASARVMEKAGLRREGLLRRYLVHPNISPEPRDCWLYARAR